MGYFDERRNVEQYIQMAEGYDGRDMVATLRRHLCPGSTVLEIGIGPGKDLDILSEFYSVTGSDSSQIFLDLYREKQPDADLLKLDATSMDTDRVFDCIYSNKVLHQLTVEELARSFARQKDRVSDGGLLMHSFWYGDKEEEHHGHRFTYYTEDTLMATLGPDIEIVETARYAEMDEDDSFYAVLRTT
jgi:trans-aconitate methyltransferase